VAISTELEKAGIPVAQVTTMTPVAKAVGYNRIVQARVHRLSVGRCRDPSQRRKEFAPKNRPTSLGRPGYRRLDDALNEIQGKGWLSMKVWEHTH